MVSFSVQYDPNNVENSTISLWLLLNFRPNKGLLKIPLFAILAISGQIRENSLIWSTHCNKNFEIPCRLFHFLVFQNRPFLKLSSRTVFPRYSLLHIFPSDQIFWNLYNLSTGSWNFDYHNGDCSFTLFGRSFKTFVPVHKNRSTKVRPL